MDPSSLEVYGPSTFKELRKNCSPVLNLDVQHWVLRTFIPMNSMEERLKKPLFQHTAVNPTIPHFPTSILVTELQRTVKSTKLNLET